MTLTLRCVGRGRAGTACELCGRAAQAVRRLLPARQPEREPPSRARRQRQGKPPPRHGRPLTTAPQELELDSMKLAEGDTPITQRIQSLQSRLAFAMERHEEVLAQRKTYEQILKRLREERTGLDPQVRFPPSLRANNLPRSSAADTVQSRMPHARLHAAARSRTHACRKISRPGGADTREPRGLTRQGCCKGSSCRCVPATALRFSLANTLPRDETLASQAWRKSSLLDACCARSSCLTAAPSGASSRIW